MTLTCLVRSSSLSFRVSSCFLMVSFRYSCTDAHPTIPYCVCPPSSARTRRGTVPDLPAGSRRDQPFEVLLPFRRPAHRTDRHRAGGRSPVSRRGGRRAVCPAASARASSEFSTSYGLPATAAACWGSGRKPLKGRSVAMGATRSERGRSEHRECADCPSPGRLSGRPRAGLTTTSVSGGSFDRGGHLLDIGHRQLAHVGDAEGLLLQVAVPVGDLHADLAELHRSALSPRYSSCW